MKFFTVFVARTGVVEIKLGSLFDAADREMMLKRPSDFAEFVLPPDKDEGLFLQEKFKAGVTPKTSVVVSVLAGQRVRAWRVRA